MNKGFILFLLAALTVGLPLYADDARLLRFPATNGTDVVFTYAGDLYKAPLSGGEAVRLTSDVGFEIFARFSPDGKQIAFTGQYDGNTEVYLIPAEGGQPKRLTYTATNARDDLGDRMGPNNMVLTWTPDGKNIVFRNRIGDGFVGQLMTIGTKGGMPREIPLPEGGFCSFAPDGKRMAYNRVMREFRTWKYYRGGMADDIWIYDPEAKKVDRITEHVAQDIFPMWIGHEIYFLSDRDKTMNLFVYDTQTRTTEKVTHYTDYDIKFPSTNGQIIVYEQGGYLFRFDPQTKSAVRIPISLHADMVDARDVYKPVADQLTAFSLSPDGNRLAVTARGEVFDVPAKKGVIRNVSRSPGANDRSAQWSPDGRYIAYIGDQTGETELWLQDLVDHKLTQLTRHNDTYILSFTWRPDSKTLLYADRKNRLVEVDASNGRKKVLLENPGHAFYHVAYSPDSRWITYTKAAPNEMSIVYVYDLVRGKEYPVTDRWYSSSDPVFSTDGKYLIFSSQRDLNPIYSHVEWNYAYTTQGGLYIALLANDTPSPFLSADAAVTVLGNPSDASAKGADKKDDVAGTKPQVRIDAEGLPQRILKLPLPTGYYRNFYSNGKKIWYAKGGDTRVYDLAEQKDEKVAEGAQMDVAAGGKKAAFFKGRSIYVTDFPTVHADLKDPVPLDNMVAHIDYAEEWNQIFHEAWRAFRDGYYLENMHGVDWKAIREKYAVLLPYVKTRLDLNYVIGEMIGELASGHAYVNPGQIDGPERISMGLLGAKLSRTPQGTYRIDHIYPGAAYDKRLRSPLLEPGMKVKEGDLIVSVNGVSVTSVDNIYQLLIGKADVPTLLGILPQGRAGTPREVVVVPTDNEYPLVHYQWVQENIRKVNEATKGRVGYIYIPDMGPEGLNEFVRYYYPQLDKEALIIDDRYNGGGNISPMIIERLLRKPYRLTMSRGSNHVGTIPEGTQVGPKVLLINKYSASDGDLFPWSFKANAIGKLIGTRTWGGIVGISGPLQYMDGTDIRVPFFTNFDARTGKWIIENHGVDPDILIDNDPIREYQGIDDQLNKAIEVILEELKTRKPLPGIPAPRTLKDLGVE